MEDWKYESARDLNLSMTERHQSYYREAGLFARFSQTCWWTSIKGLLKVYHRLEVTGLENLPQAESFVLVANHSSHLDALILGSVLPYYRRTSAFPLAAGDVFFETPITSSFSALFLNALPVWRKNVGAHGLSLLRDRLLEEPTIYILFPEGSRSRDGEMVRFKPGIGMMVAGTEVPVVPCFIEGAFQAFRPNTRVPRPGKISVKLGEALQFSEESNDRAGWKQVAEKLQSRVESLKPE